MWKATIERWAKSDSALSLGRCATLLALRLARRRDGTSLTRTAVGERLLLLRRLEDLQGERGVRSAAEPHKRAEDQFRAATHLEGAQQRLVHTHHRSSVIEFTCGKRESVLLLRQSARAELGLTTIIANDWCTVR